MRKKIALLLLSGILLVCFCSDAIGQCPKPLAGNYRIGNYLPSQTTPVTVDSANPESLYLPQMDFVFYGFNCEKRTFQLVALNTGCLWVKGIGSYSCDYDTIYYEYYVGSPGVPPPLNYYPQKGTLIRVKSIDILTTPACSGANGTALAKLSGFAENDSLSYSYQWSDGETTSLATGLSAGTYTLIVSNSCSSFKDMAYATIPYSSDPAVSLRFIKSYLGTHTQVEALATGGNSSYSYMWYPQDSSYAVASNLPVGVYTVVATDADGCTAADTVIVTKIEPTIAAITYQAGVYPNPFTGFTTVTLSKPQQYFVEIDDLTGRKQREIVFSGSQCQIAAAGLDKGIYFLRVFDNTHKIIYTTKVVLQ